VALLKQAIVAYHANRRQGTAATKGRGEVEGSTRKLFRQKGTGNARRGNIRTNLLRGGGVAFAKKPRDFRQKLSKNMRRAALRSAILAKLLGNDLLLIQGLAAKAPKTAVMAGVLRKLKIDRSCLLTLAERDVNLYLSSRNIPNLTVRIAEELNAFDVATRQKMLMTTDAMKVLTTREDQA
jgi:large subunit ribosomal protein L4